MAKRMFSAQGGRISTRVLLIIAGILAVIFVVGLILTSTIFKPHTPERAAADNFVSDMIKQDANDTYGMLSKRMQAANPKDDWSTIVSISFTNLKDKPKFVSETPVSNPVPTYGKTANPQKLIYSFTDKTRGNFKMYVIMVYENNAWKVDEFSSAS